MNTPMPASSLQHRHKLWLDVGYLGTGYAGWQSQAPCFDVPRWLETMRRDGVCVAFNKRKSCRRKKCLLKHVCAICGRHDHGGWECTSTKPAPASADRPSSADAVPRARICILQPAEAAAGGGEGSGTTTSVETTATRGREGEVLDATNRNDQKRFPQRRSVQEVLDAWIYNAAKEAFVVPCFQHSAGDPEKTIPLVTHVSGVMGSSRTDKGVHARSHLVAVNLHFANGLGRELLREYEDMNSEMNNSEIIPVGQEADVLRRQVLPEFGRVLERTAPPGVWLNGERGFSGGRGGCTWIAHAQSTAAGETLRQRGGSGRQNRGRAQSPEGQEAERDLFLQLQTVAAAAATGSANAAAAGRPPREDVFGSTRAGDLVRRSLRVRAAGAVLGSFRATAAHSGWRSTVVKEYRYFVPLGESLHLARLKDIVEEDVIGTRDFARFATRCGESNPSEENNGVAEDGVADVAGDGAATTTTRTVFEVSGTLLYLEGEAAEECYLLELRFLANGFLRHMVRRLVGHLLQNACGGMKEGEVLVAGSGRSHFLPPPETCSASGKKSNKPIRAPAEGLWLWGTRVLDERD